jgi:hypothetical protein
VIEVAGRPLPGNARELEPIFDAAAVPEPSELAGEYTVDMLTRLPTLKWMGHRKSFFVQDGQPAGHNLLLGGWVWGRFVLKSGECGDRGDTALFIDYGQPGNSFVSRPMRDYVRRVGDGLYLGRLYYKLGRRRLFLGFFALERISK